MLSKAVFDRPDLAKTKLFRRRHTARDAGLLSYGRAECQSKWAVNGPLEQVSDCECDHAALFFASKIDSGNPTNRDFGSDVSSHGQFRRARAAEGKKRGSLGLCNAHRAPPGKFDRQNRA
jgi:hypothetical protein